MTDTNKIKRYQNDHPTGNEFYYMNESDRGDWVQWEEVKKYLEDLSGLLFVAQFHGNWEDVRNAIGQMMVDTGEVKSDPEGMTNERSDEGAK